MTDQFRYWAFLSYSHTDEAFARKLHVSMERYALPRRLRKAHDLPRRLVPVFRDVEELEAASALTQRLQEALDQSRWLIVLCSPVAAASKYVNAEIEHFIGRHGARRVLCALVEGDPATSFPPAIKALKDEPLAADFRAGHDFELGKLKLIAAMALVGFTELRNREVQRKRRQRNAIAAFFAGIVLGGICYWDLFHRTHVGYYVNYVRRHGIWEGVDRIAPARAARRAETYRFTRIGRLHPPQRVDYVNAAGLCGGDGLESALGRKLPLDLEQPAQRYCAAAFTYDAGGAIRSETLVNRRGFTLESLTYTTSDLAQLTQDGYASAGSRGGIYYVQFVRDEGGRDVERRFLHSRGVPRPNDERAYGYRFDYDEHDRVVRQSALDAEGREAGEVTRYEYDAPGALVAQRHEDDSGQPRWHKAGYVTVKYIRDASGNATGQHFLGADGSPIPVGEGWAQLHYTLNAAGLVTELRYLDVAGRMVPDAPIAGRRFEYDARGNLVSERPFDANGGPAIQEGVAEYRIQYDEHDDPVLTTFHDAAGKSALHQVGNAANRKRFDERGNLVEQTFLGLDGQPVHTNFGATIRSEFDARGNRLSFRFFDAEGKPFVRPDRGIAVALWKYDERGNHTEAAFFGAKGERVVNPLGVARWQKVYDEQGNETEVRYFDAQDRPTRLKFAASVIRRRYDRAGNAVADRYFGPEGRPDADPDGGYGYDVAFDARGRVVRTTALGPDEKPVLLRGGYCIVETRYDPRGPVAEVRFLGVRGEPPPPGRAARRIHTYDGYAREIERRTEDATGAVVPEPDTGCPILRTEYDITGRVIAERCVQADGTAHTRRDEGWATRLLRYEHGRVVEEQKLDAAGKPVKPPA